jgi:hypothetical protein
MKRTRAYGVARTRSREGKGEIEKITLQPYTMCIHTLVGGGWKTMEVLVAEEYEEETR